jgi:hypothetical protein
MTESAQQATSARKALLIHGSAFQEPTSHKQEEQKKKIARLVQREATAHKAHLIQHHVSMATIAHPKQQ